MPRLTKPHAVRKGDCIAIVAPGFAVSEARLEAGAARLREAGFRVCWRSDLLAQQGYLAGSDERRAEELMQWVDDADAAALFQQQPSGARTGYQGDVAAGQCRQQVGGQHTVDLPGPVER